MKGGTAKYWDRHQHIDLELFGRTFTICMGDVYFVVPKGATLKWFALTTCKVPTFDLVFVVFIGMQGYPSTSVWYAA